MSLLKDHCELLKAILSGDDGGGSEKFSKTVGIKCEDVLSKGGCINDIIACAGDLINLFVQVNWTGPPVNLDEQLEALVGGSTVLPRMARESLENLGWDGEPAYPLLSHPLLLYTSHLLLEVCRGHLHGNASPSASSSTLQLHRWRLRCLYLQQRVINRKSASLWEEIREIIEKLTRAMANVGLSEVECCEVHLELGHVLLYYSMFEKAKEHFTKAKELAHMTFDLTGALGKRTKFQQEDTAQLLLQVTSDLTKVGMDETTLKSSLPKNLLLGDDTLLEHVQYVEPQSSNQLSLLQQAVLISHCVHMQRSSPSHRLNTEEYEAFINCVLSRPQCWSLECHALFLRCMLERKHHRRVERSMTQLQELVDCYARPHPHPNERLSLFFCISLPSHWIVQRELANVLVSLGCLQSALELYEHLEMWEEMAECLQSVGRTGRAEEVLRQQLAVSETPALWCLLGDVTKDPSYYTKAWELSNHRSARAQRSLGLYHLRLCHYEECIESLQLALSINAMQENLWFSLGCAADKVVRTELAIKSFQRCVTLDPDFGEAWNNLAGAHLKMNNKVRAYRVFKEALKCSYGNWKIWENLLVVSADVGAFDDSIHAYHRLLDLREKFVDVGILQVLVKAVVEGVVDINDNSADRLRKPLGELLGRLTSQTTSSADVWKLFADFHLASKETSDHDKALIELQKAQRMSKLESGWDREMEKLKRVISFTMDYCQNCRRICSLRDVSRKKDSLGSLSSAKLALQGVLSKASEFGLVSLPDVEQLISAMKEEKQLLLTVIDQLNSVP